MKATFSAGLLLFCALSYSRLFFSPHRFLSFFRDGDKQDGEPRVMERRLTFALLSFLFFQASIPSV